MQSNVESEKKIILRGGEWVKDVGTFSKGDLFGYDVMQIFLEGIKSSLEVL